MVQELFSPQVKLGIARETLEKLHRKLSYLVDVSAVKELDRIGVNLDENFIEQRRPEH
ncbi:MAG: hypothetical protein HYZ54_05925 [Ignavibacteriae bacterium]|nr:hypothetical protein [Ignavibacteriota bacterium]